MDPNAANVDAETLLAEADWVRRLARRLLKDEHLAEDAAQEALSLAFRRGWTGEAGSPRRWLAAVTRNLAMRWQAARRARESRERAVAQPEAEAGTGQELERLEIHRRLVEVVLELEEPYRSTLVQRFFEGLEPRDMARRQGIEPATARQRLARGLAMLRARLQGEFGGRTGDFHAALACYGKARVVAGTREILGATLMGKKVVLIVGSVLAISSAAWWFGNDTREIGHSSRHSDDALVADDSTGHAAAASAKLESHRVVLRTPPFRPPALAVEVVGELGRALAGVELFVVRGARLLDRGMTDTEGRASFAGSEDAGTLVARLHERPPAFLALERLCGEQRLDLRAGRGVAGRLLVDGDVPERPLRIELISNRDSLRELPPGTRDLLRRLGIRARERRTLLDELGRFAFHGLAPDWSGELRLPQACWFVEPPPGGAVRDGGSESAYLRGPAEGLELRATKIPNVSGRVVWADSGAGVPGARVLIHYMLLRRATGERMSSCMARVEADGQGHFEKVLGNTDATRSWLYSAERPLVRGLWISIEPHADLVPRSLDLPELALPHDLDLGDIAVERLSGAPFHFLVQDRRAEPIEGAFVRAGRVHAATDQTGHGQIAFLAADRTEVLVGGRAMRPAPSVARTRAGPTKIPR